MKVLLIKDVYKLGHAGDIKKVADGYGRNYLLPKGMAVLATQGAIKKADQIREKANSNRVIINQEMSGVADKLAAATIAFFSKAGETGKLYGSITTQMVAEAIQNKTGIAVDRHQIDVQPIRNLGEHRAKIRLTVDLIPEVKIIVHREGEAIIEERAAEKPAPVAPVAEETPAEAA
jgi:large subunit ribosomal protein L9